MEFVPMQNDVLNVGKRIKSTKRRYSWKFKLGKTEHELNLYVSKLSGKRKIIVDGDIEFNGKRASGVLFEHLLRIEGISCRVFQKEEGYELRVRDENFTDKLREKATAWISKKRDKREREVPSTEGWEEVDIDAKEEVKNREDKKFKPRSAKPMQLPNKPVKEDKENNPPVQVASPTVVKHDVNQPVKELFQAPTETPAPSVFDLLDFAPAEPELPMAEALSNIVIPPSTDNHLPQGDVMAEFSSIPAQSS